jgi:aminomethyltransferase
MKFTALYEAHKKAGAKMVEFAGYEMPVEYSGIKNEHLTVQKCSWAFSMFRTWASFG